MHDIIKVQVRLSTPFNQLYNGVLLVLTSISPLYYTQRVYVLCGNIAHSIAPLKHCYSTYPLQLIFCIPPLRMEPITENVHVSVVVNKDVQGITVAVLVPTFHCFHAGSSGNTVTGDCRRASILWS